MNYHNISYPDMNNGDGLRVVLWLSGCDHNCPNCQNPQTWNPEGGILFDEAAKKELFRELNEDYISGITFSGGDPLHRNNLKEVYELIREIHKNLQNKSIWLYTGFSWEEIINSKSDRNKIIRLCDVLVDGRYIETCRDISLKWRGSTNQRVIDVQKSLQSGEVILWTN